MVPASILGIGNWCKPEGGVSWIILQGEPSGECWPTAGLEDRVIVLPAQEKSKVGRTDRRAFS